MNESQSKNGNQKPAQSVEMMTREELIDLCEKALVPQEKWRNRDSAEAQLQIGRCWALLRAGCEFRICDREEDDPCLTNEYTVWVEITYKGFDYFDSLYDESMDEATFYIPTQKRIEERNGRDWY